MRCETMDLQALGGGNEARGDQICGIIFRDGGSGGYCCCGSVGGDIDILINGGGAVVVVVWSTPPAWKSGLLKHLFACLPTLIGGPQTKKKRSRVFFTSYTDH
jgi:hypothetical protein